MLGTGQRIGTHVTAGMQFKNLFDLFSRLATGFAAETADSALQQVVNAFRRTASALSDHRNAILHSMWHMDQDGEHPTRMKHGRSLPHIREVPIADVAGIADQIRVCYADLVQIIGRLPYIGPPADE